MLETVPPPDGLEWLVVLAIAVLIVWRVQASDSWFAPEARFWFPLRRYLATPLDEVLSRVPVLYARTDTYQREHIVTSDISLEEANDDLADAEYQPQPAASITTDWLGRKERSSWARYHGPKFGRGWLPDDLVDRFPEWTRIRQVHVRTFADHVDGPVTKAGHDEYNPWYPNPLVALAHLFGIGVDVDTGVEKAAEDLGVEPVSGPDADDES